MSQYQIPGATVRYFTLHIVETTESGRFMRGTARHYATVDYLHPSNGLRFVGVDQALAHLDESGLRPAGPGVLWLARLQLAVLHSGRGVVSIGPKPGNSAGAAWDATELYYESGLAALRSISIGFASVHDRVQSKFEVARTVFLVEVP